LLIAICQLLLSNLLCLPLILLCKYSTRSTRSQWRQQSIMKANILMHF